MRKWKRCLNMLLTAVICLAMGLVPGKRVSAGAVQDGSGAYSQREDCWRIRNSRETGTQNHKEYGLSLQSGALAVYNRGTGFFREKVFYRMRGPDDLKDFCFEDSG